MHQQHAAVFQKQRGACFIGFVFKRKLPFPAQTQGGDGRFLDEFGLVVAVPAHALVAIVIEIEQARVKFPMRDVFKFFLDEREFGSPGLGLFFHARVCIGASLIPDPCDFSFGGDQLAKHIELIETPL